MQHWACDLFISVDIAERFWEYHTVRDFGWGKICVIMCEVKNQSYLFKFFTSLTRYYYVQKSYTLIYS